MKQRKTIEGLMAMTISHYLLKVGEFSESLVKAKPHYFHLTKAYGYKLCKGLVNLVKDF